MKTKDRPEKRWKPSTEFYMILPAMIILVCITVFPFLYTIWLSFMKYPMIQLSQVKFIGFDNWATVWVNGENVGCFENEQRFGAVEIPIKLKVGDNNILIKNNNIPNANGNLWEVNCSVT